MGQQQQQQQQTSGASSAGSSGSSSTGSQQALVMYPTQADMYAYYPTSLFQLPMQGQMGQQAGVPTLPPLPQQQQQQSSMGQQTPSTPTQMSTGMSGASTPVASAATALPAGSIPTILSITSASNSLQNGVRVYPKYNDLLCCRHVCGCRRSKFDCSKSLPDDQLIKLRQQHHDKLVRALTRQRPELTKEQAQKEVGDVSYLANVAIIKRASRTQHEQNAALHTCGQQSADGRYIDYSCRKLLKSNKPPSKPSSSTNGKQATPLLSPFPSTPGQSTHLTDSAAQEEVQDEDSLLSLLYGSATKAMLSTREAFVPSSILRFVPPGVLERHHARGLALPFVQVPSSVGSEYLSSYWEGDSTIKLVLLPVEPESVLSAERGHSLSPTLPEWAQIPATAEHSRLLVAPLRSATSAAAGEPCTAVDVRDHMTRPVGYGHVSQFLHQLALGTSSTYLSTWLPPSSDLSMTVTKTEQFVDLALHELTHNSNLFRLLAPSTTSLFPPSSSPTFPLPPALQPTSGLPAALSPHCTRFAGNGYRPLGCSALFSSAAVRLSPVDTGSVVWLVVPAAHRVRAELIVAQEARRQLAKDKELPADLPLSTLLVLLYAGLLFIDPTLLIINGVPVHTVQQTASHLFVHCGDVLLGCVVLGGAAVTVYEQPFLPVSWLRDGPTRCQYWLHWISSALPTSGSSDPSPLRAVVRAAIHRIFPQPHSSSLFNALAADIAAHIAPTSPTPSSHQPPPQQQQQPDETKKAKRSSRGKQPQCVLDYSDLSDAELNRALEALTACQIALAQLQLGD